MKYEVHNAGTHCGAGGFATYTATATTTGSKASSATAFTAVTLILRGGWHRNS